MFHADDTQRMCSRCGAPYEKNRPDRSQRRHTRTYTYVGLKPLFPQGNVRNIQKCLRAEKPQEQKHPPSVGAQNHTSISRVRAAAVHPQSSASCCLDAADGSFLTSDPGIEGDAHTAVGVVGLHGNFPCATGTVTETEGGIDVSGCTGR